MPILVFNPMDIYGKKQYLQLFTLTALRIPAVTSKFAIQFEKFGCQIGFTFHARAHSLVVSLVKNTLHLYDRQLT